MGLKEKFERQSQGSVISEEAKGLVRGGLVMLVGVIPYAAINAVTQEQVCWRASELGIKNQGDKMVCPEDGKKPTQVDVNNIDNVTATPEINADGTRQWQLTPNILGVDIPQNSPLRNN